MVHPSPLYVSPGSGSVGNSNATLTVDGGLSPCCSQELCETDPEEDEEEEVVEDEDIDEACEDCEVPPPPAYAQRRPPPPRPPPPAQKYLDKRLLAALSRSPLRETRSLDPFPGPAAVAAAIAVTGNPRKPRRNSRSLENCVDASAHRSSGSLLRLRARDSRGGNGEVTAAVVPNGDARPSIEGVGGGGSSAEDVQAPLLLPAAVAGKRWRSLEEMAPGDTACALPSNGFGKKALARGSIRSWLVGLFQGNGLRAADSPALRNGLGYSDLQSESIV